MKARAMFSLISARASNHLANKLYFATGIDRTRPINVYAQLNYTCNSRCSMCDSWGKGLQNYKELPAQTWIRALSELKRFSPHIKISFAGGETLLFPGVYDIFRFCHENGIVYSLTTNGTLLNERAIHDIIGLRPLNINISFDSVDEDRYETIRGIRQLRTLQNNISHLMAYIRETGSQTPITLKPTICSTNLHELDDIVRYAAAMGMQGVTFQPIVDITEDARRYFVTDYALLQEKIDTLIAMKRQGYPILNSAERMRSWLAYFKRAPHATPRFGEVEGTARCDVPLNNLYLLASGEVKFCELYDDDVGNFQHTNIIDIVTTPRTKERQRALTHCKRNCVYCVKRSFREYIDIASKFAKKPPPQTPNR